MRRGWLRCSASATRRARSWQRRGARWLTHLSTSRAATLRRRQAGFRGVFQLYVPHTFSLVCTAHSSISATRPQALS